MSCEAARAWETRLLGGDETAEWKAMRSAGTALAEAVDNDYREIGGFPPEERMLVLIGKGHNGGDALLAAGQLLDRHPRARAEVLAVYGARALRPLAMRAWRELQQRHRRRVRPVTLRELPAGQAYALSLDGLFGLQFHPPLDAKATAALRAVNALTVRLRAAVDLPSGLNEPDAFRADFTYATGILKQPLLSLPNAGRLRYLDLGFFEGGEEMPDATDCVLTAQVLEPLRGWRDPDTDKRRQGHLLIVGGSRSFPGAALMAALAAVRSGAGLVTAFVPESLVPAFAARLPEAIWVGWPEIPAGGLALEGRDLLREHLGRAQALVVGPGLGREPETLALAAELTALGKDLPVLLDADALQPEIIGAAQGPLVLTPHAGEFARIAGKCDLRAYARKARAVVALKGPVTRVSDGELVLHSCFGGPVLARGGSGDVLAGLIGRQLARTPEDISAAVCRGVAWQGLAADALARARGTEAVRTTELLDFLGAALRE